MKQKGLWFAILGVWIVLAGILSAVAPGAKEYNSANKNGGLPEDALSVIADEKVKEYFPDSEGFPLFAVFHDKEGINDEEMSQIAEGIEAIEWDETYGEISVIPLTSLPPEVRAAFRSPDETTFFIPINLPNGLESSEISDVVKGIKSGLNEDLTEKYDVSWTGPAGIAADAVELFSKADVVLLLMTVGLILVLLLVIYRSPLLAFIPLIGAGILYVVVDKLIGLFASFGWFVTESQALSIMMILLFAVVTDYSLLVFSRFREELLKTEDVNGAMREAVRRVAEPIIFSGSTILLGVLTLFLAIYEPYRNFAPVFAIAVIVMLAGGLTLLPALFAIAGRKSFWPMIPKVGQEEKKKSSLWEKVSQLVTKRPLAVSIPLIVLLLVSCLAMFNIKFSFNLLDSYPEDLSSKVGYEQLSESFSEGEVAPSTLLIESDEKIERETLQSLIGVLEDQKEISSVTIQGNPFASEEQKVAKLSMTFEGNPYEHDAFDAVVSLREDGDQLLKESGIETGNLYIAGETAKNADIRDVNVQDMWKVMSIMTILIAVMLGVQTRSIVAPIYMIFSLLLSFGASMGITQFFFSALGAEEMSYRIPLYTYVFLVALGVDYTIMLIARIREELDVNPLNIAVAHGVAKTGNVISSAGLILAATFAVLITQPVMELKVFGFAMAIGIIIDTFIVRPLIIPGIIVMLGKWSLWPKKIS
ncbi:MMPL family transporter [Chungangia koreensis]|uniref:MMPL family transporter n=1 Tax=Chungangia koreensis TaxID=752657 RepID=A0ABV8WYU4_9LACT